MRTEDLEVAAAFAVVLVVFGVQVWWVVRHPPDEAAGPRRRAMRRAWRWNLVIVSPLAIMSFVAVVVLLVQAVVPPRKDAHFTIRRASMDVDVAGSDEPAATVAVFVLEADPGWKIVDHKAEVRATLGGPPVWTLFELDPGGGAPGTVVSGAATFGTDDRLIVDRLTVRVPPGGGADVLCTSVAPAATDGRGTQAGVPDRLRCVPMPGR